MVLVDLLHTELKVRVPRVDVLRAEVAAFVRGGGWFPTRTFAAGEVIVQEGDSLESLSERFQISVDFIRIANYNFRGDVLYAGLPLIIPMRPEMIP